MNTAAYSPRPNTEAADWPNQVADFIKSDRLNRLNKVVMEVATERSQRFVGQTAEVLVEGPNPKSEGEVMGRSRHNKLVFFKGDAKALRGKIVNVKIQRAHAYSLFGEMSE